jgi:hypothetical protein
MASSGGLRVNVRVDGVREVLAAFRRLPADANRELRESSVRIADTLAQRIRAAAAADSRQSAAVAPTVKAVKDRVPAVQAGGAKKVTRPNASGRRATASNLLFGSEFGATRHFGWYAKARYFDSTARQFRPHSGASSFWFFDTVERNQNTISDEWNQAADEIVRLWGSG